MEIIDRIKDKIRAEVSDIEQRTDLTSEQKIEKICVVFGTFCGALAAQPIPFADIFVLTPIQAYMGKKIADIHGYHITEQSATSVVREMAGLIGLGLLSQQLAIGAYKTFIPFLGAITTIPLVFGLTYGMGKVMNAYFKAKIKGEAISKEHIQNVFRNAKKEGQKIGKEKEKDIIRENVEVQPESQENLRKVINRDAEKVDKILPVNDGFAACERRIDAVAESVQGKIRAAQAKLATARAAKAAKAEAAAEVKAIPLQEISTIDQALVPSTESIWDPKQVKAAAEKKHANIDANYNVNLCKNIDEDSVLQLVNNRIRSAISSYNRRLSQRRSEIIRENKAQFIPALIMDETALELAMYKTAKASENAAEFITRLRSSEVSEVKRVLRFLKTGTGKNSEVNILTAYYNLAECSVNTIRFGANFQIDAKINAAVADAHPIPLRAQQIMKRLETQSKARSHEALQNYAETMEYIRTNSISEINPQAYLEVLQYFGDCYVDYNKMMEYGFLNVSGRPVGIATLIKSMAEKAVEGKYIYAKSDRQGGRGMIIKFDVNTHGLYHTSGTIHDVYGYRPRVDDINRQPLYGKKYVGPYLPVNSHYRGMVDALLFTDAQLKNSQST